MCQKVNNSVLQNIRIIKVFLHNKMNFESALKKTSCPNKSFVLPKESVSGGGSSNGGPERGV
jgi:hypothetical protein